jgi:hypothetical protein
MDSFHPYSTQIEHSSGPFQILIILLIELLPLASISWMAELPVALLALIRIPPAHQFSIFGLKKKRLRRSATGRYHITIAQIFLCSSEMPKVVSVGSTEATLFVAPFLFLLFPFPGS